MIVDPVTITPEQTIADALEVMRRYKISGVPVTKNKKLVGILTNRDLRFVSRTDLTIDSVMTKDEPDYGAGGDDAGAGGTDSASASGGEAAGGE